MPYRSADGGHSLHLEPPTQLSFREHDIAACCGAPATEPDFSWLDPTLMDRYGQPRHHGAAAPVPGLWYVGLRWLTRRSSGNFLGFPADAAIVSDAVAATLGNGRGRRSAQASLVTTLGIAPP